MKRRRSDARKGANPALVGTLAEAGTIRAWEWDPATGHFLLDEGAADLMAGDGDLAGRALRGERATAGLDLQEADRFLAELFRATEQGEDEVSAEFHFAAVAGGLSRVLCRGRIERDGQERPVRAEGTLVDVAALSAEARALLGHDRDIAAEAIDEAAELLIAARQAIDLSGSRKLRRLVDAVLMELGREIASRPGSIDRPQH
ncbi:hypothetical protein [Methylobacterium sp. B4]|uniref:hypothetical protein n=1 Tax=Methylobacterium sp. B4 TaxID=1938755 RepID=UPI000D8873A6|nr:hypothetical protein [Methylobacterium sp. B4]PXW64079.1 hypothetical protein BY998_104131 [Methylobacterium sp. B4]